MYIWSLCVYIRIGRNHGFGLHMVLLQLMLREKLALILLAPIALARWSPRYSIELHVQLLFIANNSHFQSFLRFFLAFSFSDFLCRLFFSEALISFTLHLDLSDDLIGLFEQLFLTIIYRFFFLYAIEHRRRVSRRWLLLRLIGLFLLQLFPGLSKLFCWQPVALGWSVTWLLDCPGCGPWNPSLSFQAMRALIVWPCYLSSRLRYDISCWQVRVLLVVVSLWLLLILTLLSSCDGFMLRIYEIVRPMSQISLCSALHFEFLRHVVVLACLVKIEIRYRINLTMLAEAAELFNCM